MKKFFLRFSSVLCVILIVSLCAVPALADSDGDADIRPILDYSIVLTPLYTDYRIVFDSPKVAWADSDDPGWTVYKYSSTDITSADLTIGYGPDRNWSGIDNLVNQIWGHVIQVTNSGGRFESFEIQIPDQFVLCNSEILYELLSFRSAGTTASGGQLIGYDKYGEWVSYPIGQSESVSTSSRTTRLITQAQATEAMNIFGPNSWVILSYASMRYSIEGSSSSYASSVQIDCPVGASYMNASRQAAISTPKEWYQYGYSAGFTAGSNSSGTVDDTLGTAGGLIGDIAGADIIPNVNAVNPDVSGFVSPASVALVSGPLSIFYDVPIVFTMLLLVAILAFGAYVLFGER